MNNQRLVRRITRARATGWRCPAAVLGLLALLAADPVLAQMTNGSPSSSTADLMRLFPGDTVTYNIREDPAPGGPFVLTISSQGQVAFPVTRADPAVQILIEAQDRTVTDVGEELKKKLDQLYYYDATVDLRLKEKTRKQGQVLFDGAVRNAIVPLEPGGATTLYEALIKAGPTEFANLKKVKVRRFNPTTGKTDELIINAEEAKKDRRRDLVLQDGDRVEVVQKWINFF